jgi:hypothetical protein
MRTPPRLAPHLRIFAEQAGAAARDSRLDDQSVIERDATQRMKIERIGDARGGRGDDFKRD